MFRLFWVFRIETGMKCRKICVKVFSINDLRNKKNFEASSKNVSKCYGFKKDIDRSWSVYVLM